MRIINSVVSIDTTYGCKLTLAVYYILQVKKQIMSTQVCLFKPIIFIITNQKFITEALPMPGALVG